MLTDNDRILKERAAQLAASSVAEQQGELIELVSFSIGREKYALMVDEIREIQPVTEVTPVPSVPGFVRGLMNLRGSLLTVLDLHEFLSVKRPGMRDASRVIVLASDELDVGLAVREVFDLVRIGAASILQPLTIPDGIEPRFLQGMLTDLTLIINAQAILMDPRMIIDDGHGQLAHTRSGTDGEVG